MRTSKDSYFGLATSKVAIAIMAVLAMNAAAGATSIMWMSANVSPTPVYMADSQQWLIPGATLSNGTATDFLDSWSIAPTSIGAPPGTFDWAASLAADLNPGGPLAHGRFAPGGTITITGKVYDSSNNPILDGTLLEATLSAFEMKESNGNQGQMDLVGSAILTPTSGLLVNNSLSMKLEGVYYLYVTIANAQQSMSYVDDFQSDIISVSSLQFDLVQVPEPGSLALLGGLAGLLLRRRRTR
jgi:hypothetical protein